STCLADVEEAFDLFIDPSNRLHLAFLVHGSSDRKTLLDGHLGEGRQQRRELRRGGAVAVAPAIGLLENQGSRQGQWYILGIPPGKVAPEDHDALRVQRPAELHLALDVDDAALPHSHPGGDAARPAEGERPDLNDRKAVDLANLGTVGVDEDDVALDDLLRPVADSTGALDAFLDGPLDVLAGGHLAGGHARPVVGLTDQIGDAADLDRQLFTIVGEPRAFLDHSGHARGVDWLQLVLLHDRGDDARVGEVVLIRPRNRVVEIGLNFEEATEVGIESGEQVIELAIPEQHDLDVERNGFRIERLGRDETQAFQRLLDADLARLDGSLQGFPGIRGQQQLARVDEQVAAVGLVQRAGLDQQEV